MFQNYLNFNYDRGKVLGHGTYGSVFKGKFEGRSVAVKRTPLVHVIDLAIEDEYLKSIKHPNLVMLLHITRDEDFRYAVMELCAASMDRLFLENGDNNKFKLRTKHLKKQVLLQLANGLGYLHSLNIMHGDIKPENILIFSTSPVQMKWTGFGFRQLKRDFSSINKSSQSAKRMGSRIWWAPEMYKDEANVSEKGEIFSAGCVFLYFLSGGLHPFGNPELGEFIIAVNVIKGDIVHPIDLSVDKLDFVENMIMTNPDDRIPLQEVIEKLENLERSNSIIGLPFESLQYEEKSYQNGQYSIGLCVLKREKVVVKRIPTNYFSKKPFKEFTQYNISNIVRILYMKEVNRNTFVSIELCSASLDHLFLPEGDKNKYTGPMPSHEEVFFQLVTGLQYIHRNGLVHGSIKPSNILICLSQNPQIKLSESGLTLPRWSTNNASAFSGFQSDQYWFALELHHAFTAVERKDFTTVFKPTKESDVFAAGKVFFYYYNQTYTYAIPNSASGLSNAVLSENKEDVFKRLPMTGYCKVRSEHFPIQMISKMTEKERESRFKLKTVVDRIISYQLTSKGELKKPKDLSPGDSVQSRIKFSRDHILGKGGQAVVHLGFWDDSIVAVKRISNRSHKPEVTKELKLIKMLDHCNIVKFYGSENDNDFMYIALELCLVSLNSYCRQPQLYHGVIPMPSDQQVLLQMAKGLQYIHSKNLIHRDVKPGNILISGDRPTAIIKWSDFGLSKAVNNEKKEVSSKEEGYWSFPQGTEGWMAPEMFNTDEKSKDDDELKGGRRSDIFSLGCVFFFFLFSAAHPFGNNNFDRRANIVAGNATNFIKYYKRNLQFNKIIEGMIVFDSSQRTRISKVIEQLHQCDEDSEISDLTDGLNSQLSLQNISPLDSEPDIKKRKKQ